MLMDVLPGVFLRRDPAGAAAPVVFDIPRSGAEFPRSFRSVAPLADMQRSCSSHVEDLYGAVPEAGATWLFACFPNIFIDPNRHELDIDPDALDGAWPEKLQPSEKTRAGIGLVPTICGGGTQLYDGPLPVAEVQARLDGYYRPYHAELARLLRGFRDAQGIALHISCHSMSGHAPPGGPDGGKRRSDFDLGDRHGTTCGAGLTDLVESVLRGFGYDVTRNRHFIGAECVRRHGDPAKGIHSLQIEVNRGLYMDETTRQRRPAFAPLREHLAELARQLARHAATAAAAR